MSIGADLKRRIIRTLAVAGPVVFGLLNVSPGRAQSQPASAPSEAFEVASIKPNKSAERNVNVRVMNAPGGRFSASNVSLKMLIRMAYGVQDYQILGGPGWINSERYDIEAKAAVAPGEEPRTIGQGPSKVEDERRKRMLQALLADRCKLTLQHDTRELPVYALVVAKSGPKLKQSADVPAAPDGQGSDSPKGPGAKGRMVRIGRGEVSGQAAPLSLLTDGLASQLGRPVLDKTGLKGLYDFTLQWTPDASQGRMVMGPADGNPGAGSTPPPDASGPSIFTAIQEQLGLKLESQKGPVEVLVIERIERPSEN